MNANDASERIIEAPAPAPKRRRGLAVLLTLLIFACGAVTGGGAALILVRSMLHYGIQHPDKAPEWLSNRIAARLDLSPDQKERVTEILTRHQAAFKDLRREFQPRVREQFESLRDEVAGVLDASQAARWKRTLDRLWARWAPPLPAPSPQGPR